MIFGVIADPIAAGVMNDLTSPGGNMTGVKLDANQARRLQFLLETAPDIKRILIPYNPKDAASSSAVAQLNKVAPGFGVEIVERLAYNDRAAFELLNNLPMVRNDTGTEMGPCGTNQSKHPEGRIATVQQKKILRGQLLNESNQMFSFALGIGTQDGAEGDVVENITKL